MIFDTILGHPTESKEVNLLVSSVEDLEDYNGWRIVAMNNGKNSFLEKVFCSQYKLIIKNNKVNIGFNAYGQIDLYPVLQTFYKKLNK